MKLNPVLPNQAAERGEPSAMWATLFLPFAFASFAIALLTSCSHADAGESSGTVLRFGSPASVGDAADPMIGLDEISHATFDGLLRRYVDNDGLVCYSRWQDSSCDKRRLQAYIHSLTRIDPSVPSSHEAMMAYYINAYNALTIWGILHEYPVPSIQRIDGKRTQFAIFDDLQFWTGDQYLSLNGIENHILRPLGDPRIHFALVCAAKGCPRLRNRAYTAELVHGQLDDNAREFFSDRNRFHISKLTCTVKMSPILKWYRDDFGQTDFQVVQTVFQYLPAKDRQWLSCHPGWKFEYLGYNWALNDQCPTLGVALAAGPHKAWSKMSPKIDPIREKLTDSNGNATTGECGCADAVPTEVAALMPYSGEQPMYELPTFPAPHSDVPAPVPGEYQYADPEQDQSFPSTPPAPYNDIAIPQP
jgi:hypothetical protein